jgi:hypothetical protein
MNPYQKLPQSSFWRSGVVEDEQFLNIHTPKWGIDKSDCIVTMGSCFAQHVGKKLKSTGFNVPYFDLADGIKSKSYSANYGNIYTVRQALQLLQESNGNFTRDEKYWEVESGYLDPLRPNVFLSPFETIDELDRNRQLHLESVRLAIENLDVLVFTLGLTEAWIRVSCKSVLPVIPGVLGGSFNEEDYKFHNFNFTEVSSDLSSLIEEMLLIRKGKKFKLLLTVSPVPLTATAEPRHVLISTVASKSILRAVADEFARNFEFIDYFPSYEIITNPKYIAKNYEQNLRNVKQSSVDKVMELFSSTYVKEGAQPIEKKSSNLIDGAGDIDCEEALLEAFSDSKHLSSVHRNDKEKILFFGNSHIAGVKNALGSRAEEFTFVPANFLENSPFSELEKNRFSKFILREPFKSVENVNADYLVWVGLGLFGDGIIRTIGQIGPYVTGMSRNEHSPDLPLTEGDVIKAYPKIVSFVLNRLTNLSKVVDASLFKAIVLIPAPDIPEITAINRFGMSAVDSGIYCVLKKAYSEIFNRLFDPLKEFVKLLPHDKDLNKASGFLDDKFAAIDNPYDIHPVHSFYSTQNIAERIFDALRVDFFEDKNPRNTIYSIRCAALEFLNDYIAENQTIYSAYTVKAEILLDMQREEEAKAVIQRSIDLGDERHSTYRQASNISHRLNEIDDAITFAKQAVKAKDNNYLSHVDHKEHLANMLRVGKKLDVRRFFYKKIF